MPLSLTPSDEIAVPILVKFAGLLYVTKIDHNCFRSILDDHGKVLKLREVQSNLATREEKKSRNPEIQKCWSAQVTDEKSHFWNIFLCCFNVVYLLIQLINYEKKQKYFFMFIIVILFIYLKIPDLSLIYLQLSRILIYSRL